MKRNPVTGGAPVTAKRGVRRPPVTVIYRHGKASHGGEKAPWDARRRSLRTRDPRVRTHARGARGRRVNAVITRAGARPRSVSTCNTAPSRDALRRRVYTPREPRRARCKQRTAKAAWLFTVRTADAPFKLRKRRRVYIVNNVNTQIRVSVYTIPAALQALYQGFCALPPHAHVTCASRGEEKRKGHKGGWCFVCSGLPIGIPSRTRSRHSRRPFAPQAEAALRPPSSGRSPRLSARPLLRARDACACPSPCGSGALLHTGRGRRHIRPFAPHGRKRPRARGHLPSSGADARCASSLRLLRGRSPTGPALPARAWARAKTAESPLRPACPVRERACATRQSRLMSACPIE